MGQRVGEVGSQAGGKLERERDDGWITDPYLELVVDVGGGRGLLAV